MTTQTEWQGEYYCPKCKAEMAKYHDDHGAIDVCWKCKTVFRVIEYIHQDMRD